MNKACIFEASLNTNRKALASFDVEWQDNYVNQRLNSFQGLPDVSHNSGSQKVRECRNLMRPATPVMMSNDCGTGSQIIDIGRQMAVISEIAADGCVHVPPCLRDSNQISILKQGDEVGLGGLLKSHDDRGQEA